MIIKKKMLLISAALWTVLNAGVVLLFEFLFRSVTAEVVASTVFSLLWVVFAVVFCRYKERVEE